MKIWIAGASVSLLLFLALDRGAEGLWARGRGGDPLFITAAGATFPYPIYSKWFDEYHKLHPDIQINYQPIGSGGGIRQLQEGTVDFGASDMPMTDQQIKAMKVKPLHFPTVMGAVVLTYNLPGIKTPVNLTPEVIAGIYLGTIDKWTDPKIAADNKGVKFPNA